MVCGKLIFLIISAVTAGIALDTKLSFIIVVPFLLLFIIPPFNMSSLKKALGFYSILLLSFFIIGYPSSILLTHKIAVLVDQSYLHDPWSISSVMDWLILLIDQSYVPVLCMLILFVPFCNPIKVNISTLLRLFLITFIPIVVLISRDVLTGHPHYTLTHVSMIIVFVSILFRFFKFFVFKYYPIKFTNFQKISLSILSLFIIEISIGIFPRNVVKVFNELNAYRSEAEYVYNELNNNMLNGKKIMGSVYAPYGFKYLESDSLLKRSHLRFRLDDIKNFNPDIITIRKDILPIIMEGETPSKAKMIDPFIAEYYPDIREFYDLFYKKNRSLDPYNNYWVLKSETQSGIQIWEKATYNY